MKFDLRINNGTLVDGTGAAAFKGDIALRDGKIAAIGQFEGEAKETIDATDQVVSPGFIDLHTHYDAQILWDPILTVSPWHGVTTAIMGNCGFGVAPTRPEHRQLILRTLEKVEGMSLESLNKGLGNDWGFESFPEYLDAIEARGTAINVGTLIGHTPLRTYVMGEQAVEREATSEEVGEMAQIIEQAIEAGALGFASSRTPTHMGYDSKPVPSRLASLEEYKTLASVLGEKNKGVLQISMGSDLTQDILADIARDTGRPITWTALLAGIKGPQGHRDELNQAVQLQSEGLEIRPQVSCRQLSFEFHMEAPFLMESFNCFKEFGAGVADKAGKIEIYKQQAFRDALKQQQGFGTAWGQTVVSYFPADTSLEERYIEDIAKEKGSHAIDVLLDMALESDLSARFRMGVANTDETDLTELLSSEAVVLGLSDAGAHASQLCDACFSTDLLSRWVREKNVLTLERAIYMLSGQVAELLSIKDRGKLIEGLAGDIVIFDPKTIGCSPLIRVHDQPGGQDRLIAESYGIKAVIVNGVTIRADGENQVTADDNLPGQLVRGA